MFRPRRFPLISVIVALLLGGVIGYLTFMDVDVPSRAMAKVGEAVANFGNTLQLMFEPGERQQQPKTASLPLLVNYDHPVAQGYTPGGLVAMQSYCDPSVVQIKEADMQGQREAVDALMVMLRAAIEQGMGNWQISAGYRSVASQQSLWNDRVNEYLQDGLSESQAETATAKYVAQPGHSEHHTGLAFDVTVPGQSFPLTEQSRWLAANCWDYGFIIRYTEDKVEITRINAEPWHIRYVGQPHARAMRDNNWCLEEYLAAVANGYKP